MAGIYGHLGLNDGERVFLSTLGQSVVLDAINKYLADVNAEIDAAYNVFIENDTEDHKQRYMLPGLPRKARLQRSRRTARGTWRFR